MQNSIHYCQALIMGTVAIIKIKGENEDGLHFLGFIRNNNKKKL